MLQGRDTRVSVLSSISVRGALRAMKGETCMCPPCPAPMCGKRYALLGWERDTHVSVLSSIYVLGVLRAKGGATRTCLPCPAPLCGKRFAL